MNRVPKVRTLLFTEICPLNCNYCNLRARKEWSDTEGFSKQKIFEEVRKAEKEGVTRLLFTGGEPFCRWPWIKEIIEAYGNRFQYSFNTSGYLLTSEIIEFLSDYKVSFQLSVDGPREIAMWRRPNYHSDAYDYWDKFEKIIPDLLYYFPDTAWKSIISRRLIPFLPKIYAAAADYGFRKIQFELDFEEQEWRFNDGREGWTDKDWKAFERAITVITAMMCEMMSQGIIPCLETHIWQYLRFMFRGWNNIPFSIGNVNCGLSAERDIVSLYSEKDSASNCMGEVQKKENISFLELLNKIEKEQSEGCQNPGAESCPYYAYCSKYSCLKDNWTATGKFFKFPDEWCKQTKIYCNAALYFITYCNNFYKDGDSSHFTDFIRRL